MNSTYQFTLNEGAKLNMKFFGGLRVEEIL